MSLQSGPMGVQATFTTSAPSAGTHTSTAHGGGDDAFTASDAYPLFQIVM